MTAQADNVVFLMDSQWRRPSAERRRFSDGLSAAKDTCLTQSSKDDLLGVQHFVR